MTAIRPSSSSKPDVVSLRERGADIRIVDLDTLSHEQLVSELRSAHTDVLISTLTPRADLLQRTLAKAAKEAGVKRFIPSDWASACPPGVMLVQDAVSYSISLNYIFTVDVIAPILRN